MRISPLILAALVAAPFALAGAQGRVPVQVDVLIRGGEVVDGTGSAPRRADIGITGDRIVFVGNSDVAMRVGKRTIDAAGLVVAPGFIDAHTHTSGDLSNAQRRGNVAYLMQGVTTVITNNDGGGIDVGKMFDTWTKQGIGTNAAAYVGHGAVRGRVMGASGMEPTPKQLDSMRTIVSKAMDEGALGLSTGLYYAPGSFAKTEEVIELAKVAARKGGVYDSHMRDESSYTIGLIGSINETIRIAREARIPANIAHIKALGVDVWGQPDSVIKLVRAARAQGLQITADQYPWTASGTGVGAALLPRWVEEGGNEMMRRRLNDPELHDKIVAEMTDNMRRRGGAAALLMTSTRVPGILGKNLGQIAKERGKDPITTAIEIILAGGSSVASFNMNEKDIRRFMAEEWVSTGSDGSDGHPRKYATYPKLLREYVYTDKVLTIEKAVERSSSRVAKAAKIRDRGTLASGMFADVIVFDPKTIEGKATYDKPTEFAVGMRYVFVNGQIAVEDGRYMGVTSGRVLKGPGAR